MDYRSGLQHLAGTGASKHCPMTSHSTAANPTRRMPSSTSPLGTLTDSHQRGRFTQVQKSRWSEETRPLSDIQTSSLGFFFSSLITGQKGRKLPDFPDICSARFVFVAHGKGLFLMINYLLLGMTTFKVSTLILSDLPLITMTTLCCWYSCGFWQRQRQLLELVRSTTSFWDLEKGGLDFKPVQVFPL